MAIITMLLALTPYHVAFAAPPGDLIRIISPVRLPSQPGPELDKAVIDARAILERFQKGGFEYAVWAVDSIPREEDIKVWTETCLKAFPGKVILAIDAQLKDGKSSLPAEALKPFLKQALPKVHSVLVNFSDLSNCSCSSNSAEALALVRANADIVRSVSKKKFTWLLVDDCAKGAPLIPEWNAALGESANGFFVERAHEWIVANDKSFNEAAQPLIKSGKPVIRAGFRYSCARPRPGIEQDIADNYKQRTAIYEKWIGDTGQAGYSREIGEAVPRTVSAATAFVNVQ